MHEAGQTVEAKADLERLALIKKQARRGESAPWEPAPGAWALAVLLPSRMHSAPLSVPPPDPPPHQLSLSVDLPFRSARRPRKSASRRSWQRRRPKQQGGRNDRAGAALVIFTMLYLVLQTYVYIYIPYRRKVQLGARRI